MKVKNLRILREVILKRDNYICQECGSTENLECHHIKPRCDYPELTYETDNCTTLCHDCHTKTDSYKVFRHHKKSDKSKNEIKKICRLTNEQNDKLDNLVRILGISENDIFRIAICRLYKDFD